MRTHYDNLRIPKESTPAQIKSAYRKIVLEHHPDMSDTAASKAIFLAATESYGILSDPMKRRSYDATLEIMSPPKSAAQPKATPPKTAAPKTGRPKPAEPKPAEPEKPKDPPRPTIPQQLAELQRMVSRGKLADAEDLARKILQESPKEAIPYAVLADLARSRGNINEAARLFAFAAQFAPTNPEYQRRYEELLERSNTRSTHGNITLEAPDLRLGAPLVGAGIVMAAGSYIVFSNEAALFPGLKLISTWTLGLLVMLFLSGVVVGTSLSLGNLLERFPLAATSSIGRFGPVIALGFVAVVNFWAAAGLYLVLGFSQRAFNLSTSRFVAGVASATLLLSTAAAISHNLDGVQTLLWGGNSIYIGAICGWMVADAFRS